MPGVLHRSLPGGGRFRATASWRKVDGATGEGTAVPITSDTGYFWFFSPENIEVVTKVLDGCFVNDHYWVFAGGLTNVEVTLAVTDTETGEVRTYLNPLGTASSRSRTFGFPVLPPLGNLKIPRESVAAVRCRRPRSPP